MKIVKCALLGLICLTLTSGKYGNIPTNGQIGIVIVNSEGETIEQSDIVYSIDKYTYSTENNGEFVFRIPDIYVTNSESYQAIKNWIEWVEEEKGIDVCEKITEVSNKEYPDIGRDACFVFKQANIAIDKNGFYESIEKNIRILTVIL